MTKKTAETETAAAPDNMALWDSVCETDPKTTKRVKQRGGFTAICAQSQLRRATEIWGPYGGAWGLRQLEWSLVPELDGNVQQELVLQAEFFYPPGGSFPVLNSIKWAVGNEVFKKLVTDTRSKVLSTLGFNSDVFEGLYDDNRYVADMQKKYAADSEPEPGPDPAPEPAGDDKAQKTAYYTHMRQVAGHRLLDKPWLDAKLEEKAMELGYRDLRAVPASIFGEWAQGEMEWMPEPSHRITDDVDDYEEG